MEEIVDKNSLTSWSQHAIAVIFHDNIGNQCQFTFALKLVEQLSLASSLND